MTSMTIWTGAFWRALAERVLATFIAALLGYLLAEGFDFRHADWGDLLEASLFAAGISLLKGVLANLGTKNGPSLLSAEQVVPPEPQPKG